MEVAVAAAAAAARFLLRLAAFFSALDFLATAAAGTSDILKHPLAYADECLRAVCFRITPWGAEGVTEGALLCVVAAASATARFSRRFGSRPNFVFCGHPKSESSPALFVQQRPAAVRCCCVNAMSGSPSDADDYLEDYYDAIVLSTGLSSSILAA